VNSGGWPDPQEKTSGISKQLCIRLDRAVTAEKRDDDERHKVQGQAVRTGRTKGQLAIERGRC